MGSQFLWWHYTAPARGHELKGWVMDEPKACEHYTRPKGVLGGPCLICGRSSPEHVRHKAIAGLAVCDSYWSMVFNGDCARCGHTVHEHNMKAFDAAHPEIERQPVEQIKGPEFLYEGLHDMYDKVTWELVQTLLRGGDLRAAVRKELTIIIFNAKRGTLYPP
jgi:hypothetical protein